MEVEPPAPAAAASASGPATPLAHHPVTASALPPSPAAIGLRLPTAPSPSPRLQKPQHGPAVCAVDVAALQPQERSQFFGERLFPLVHAVEPDRAGKIVGMLVEMDDGELYELLGSPEALNAKVVEAADVLDTADRSIAGGAAPITTSTDATTERASAAPAMPSASPTLPSQTPPSPPPSPPAPPSPPPDDAHLLPTTTLHQMLGRAVAASLNAAASFFQSSVVSTVEVTAEGYRVSAGAAPVAGARGAPPAVSPATHAPPPPPIAAGGSSWAEVTRSAMPPPPPRNPTPKPTAPPLAPPAPPVRPPIHQFRRFNTPQTGHRWVGLLAGIADGSVTAVIRPADMRLGSATGPPLGDLAPGALIDGCESGRTSLLHEVAGPVTRVDSYAAAQQRCLASGLVAFPLSLFARAAPDDRPTLATDVHGRSQLSPEAAELLCTAAFGPCRGALAVLPVRAVGRPKNIRRSPSSQLASDLRAHSSALPAAADVQEPWYPVILYLKLRHGRRPAPRG